MYSTQGIKHPTPEQLADYAGYPHFISDEMTDHIDSCPACRQQIETIKRSISEYRTIEIGQSIPAGEHHLSDGDIRNYVAGRIPRQKRKQLKKHIHHCDECQLALLHARKEQILSADRPSLTEIIARYSRGLIGQNEWRYAVWSSLSVSAAMMLVLYGAVSVMTMSSTSKEQVSLAHYRDSTRLQFSRESDGNRLGFMQSAPVQQGPVKPVEVRYQDRKLTLNWHPVPGAQTYTVELLSPDAGQDVPIHHIETGNPEANLAVQLKPGKHYRWRISGKRDESRFWLEGGFVVY